MRAPRRLLLLFLAIWALIFLISTGLSLRILVGTHGWVSSLSGPLSDPVEGRERILFLAPASADPFYERLWNAVDEGARERGITLEGALVSYENNLDEILRYLDLAFFSRVEGVILYGLDEAPVLERVDRLVAAGIPVVTVDVDLPYSQRQVFVGTSPYRFGSQAARIIQESLEGQEARIAVIISQSEGGWSPNQSANLISGLRQGLRSPGFEIVAEDSAAPGLFSSEEAIRRLLLRDPGINVVYSSSSLATLSAAHSLVDMNRVGQVLLVGTDDHPEIRNYVGSGVIRATLLRNPQEMGRLALAAVLDLREGSLASAFQDPGLGVLDRTSLDLPADAGRVPAAGEGP